MPTDRPTAAELVSAVKQHLQDNVVPVMEGQPAFHLRVAINALAIVERTMADGETMNRAELERLRVLLGEDGNLIDLNRRLSAQIEAGEMGEQKDTLLTHLRRTALDKLQLANPRYLIPRD